MNSIEYLEGGGELLDLVGPLWEKLDAHHARVSRHFSDRSSGSGFSGRKKGLLEKTAPGKLRVDLVKLKDNARHIGYCISSIDQKHVGEIESIFVDEEFRNQGLGHDLMQKAPAWMENEQVKSKIVGVVYGNERAFPFYARYGFFPSATILRQKKAWHKNADEYSTILRGPESWLCIDSFLKREYRRLFKRMLIVTRLER